MDSETLRGTGEDTCKSGLEKSGYGGGLAESMVLILRYLKSYQEKGVCFICAVS